MPNKTTLRGAPRGEVCFTGFDTADRNELEAIAATAGFYVRKSVTPSLSYVVAGMNGGSSRLSATARGLGKEIINEATFRMRLSGSAL
jgi:NAD-dependent DNA ligase